MYLGQGKRGRCLVRRNGQVHAVCGVLTAYGKLERLVTGRSIRGNRKPDQIQTGADQTRESRIDGLVTELDRDPTENGRGFDEKSIADELARHLGCAETDHVEIHLLARLGAACDAGIHSGLSDERRRSG